MGEMFWYLTHKENKKSITLIPNKMIKWHTQKKVLSLTGGFKRNPKNQEHLWFPPGSLGNSHSLKKKKSKKAKSIKMISNRNYE